jgi:hypothetical protein
MFSAPYRDPETVQASIGAIEEAPIASPGLLKLPLEVRSLESVRPMADSSTDLSQDPRLCWLVRIPAGLLPATRSFKSYFHRGQGEFLIHSASRTKRLEQTNYLWAKLQPILVQPATSSPALRPFAGMEFVWRSTIPRQQPSVWKLSGDSKENEKLMGDLDATCNRAMEAAGHYRCVTPAVLDLLEARYTAVKLRHKSTPKTAPSVVTDRLPARPQLVYSEIVPSVCASPYPIPML